MLWREFVESQVFRCGGRDLRCPAHFEVRGFPPIRQKEGEWMGHGAGGQAIGRRPGGDCGDYGPMDEGVQVFFESEASVTGVGGVGGVAQGAVLKSKKSSKSG